MPPRCVRCVSVLYLLYCLNMHVNTGISLLVVLHVRQHIYDFTFILPGYQKGKEMYRQGK